MGPISSQPFVSPGSSDEPGVRPAGIDHSESATPENNPEKTAGKQGTSGSSHSLEPRLRQRERGAGIDTDKTADSLSGRPASDAAGDLDGVDALADGRAFKAASGHALHGATEPVFKMPDGYSKSFAVETMQDPAVELPRDVYVQILETMLRSLDKAQLDVEAYAAKRLDMLSEFSLVNRCCNEISSELLLSPEFAHECKIQCSRQLDKVLRSTDDDASRLEKIRIICNSHPVIYLRFPESGTTDPFGDFWLGDNEVYSKQADLLFKGIFSSDPGKKIEILLGTRITGPATIVNALARQAQLFGRDDGKPLVALQVRTWKNLIKEVDWKILQEHVDLCALSLHHTSAGKSLSSRLSPLFQKNTNLKSLDIDGITHSHHDVTALISALMQGAPALEFFRCREKKLYAPVFRALSEWLGSNPALKEVEISSESVDMSTILELITSLAKNTNLRSLAIGPRILTDDTVDCLKETMEARSIPLVLSLGQGREKSLSLLSSDSRQKLHDLESSGLRVNWRQE